MNKENPIAFFVFIVVFIVIVTILVFTIGSKNIEIMYLEIDRKNLNTKFTEFENRIKTMRTEETEYKKEIQKINSENEELKKAFDIVKYGEQRIINTISSAYRNNQSNIARQYIDFSLKYFPESLNIDEIKRYDSLIKQREIDERQREVVQQNEKARLENQQKTDRINYINSCRIVDYNAINNFSERYIGQNCKFDGIVTNKFRSGQDVYFILVTGLDETKMDNEISNKRKEIESHRIRNFFFGNNFNEEEWLLGIIKEAYTDKILVSLRLSSSNDDINNGDVITVYGKYRGKKDLTLNNELSVYNYLESQYYDSDGETIEDILYNYSISSPGFVGLSD
jgi:hypothetical protein